MYFRSSSRQLGLIFWALSITAIAKDPVIYGVDNRIDTYESTNPLYQQLASATAAHVPLSNLQIVGRRVDLNGGSLMNELNVCSEARFSHQPSITRCSGVLVAPDIIATAGHCVMSPDQCSDYVWVFNYKVRNPRQKTLSLRSRDLYRCKKILMSEIRGEDADFALIRLDRPVENATPVKVATAKPAVGTKLVTIGNPSGLPQKIADGAVVKSVTRTEFKANLDTFDRGSGSPVFNATTGEYLGILVRGATDFVDTARGCQLPNVIPDHSPGEDVASTIQFQRFIKALK